jgi:hypothetical protein
MSERLGIHAFPTARLGAFLRAMEDPEGKGRIDPDREREIAKIERELTREAPGEDGDA